MNIKYAVEADAPAIAHIHVASWQKVYQGHIPNEILDKLSIEKRTHSWRDLIIKGIKILILEKEKQVIGFASICPSRDLDKPADQCGEISAIYLHPDFWRQGLGKLLCSSALAELSRTGYHEVILWVLKENIQARQFYEFMGFKFDGNEKIDNLSACTLGVIAEEEATETVNVPLHEVRYCKKLMSADDIMITVQKNLGSNFLSSFTRPKIDYFNTKDSNLLEAYQSGIYDATVNFVGESHLRITGTSKTIEEVKKFLRQTSFNGELTLSDHKGNLLKTVTEQEFLVDTWFQENPCTDQYMQLILMIPKDNDRTKLSKIVRDFFQKKFNGCKYVYVEHTDTDVYHYHIIIEKSFNDNMILQLRSDFISLCIENQARLL